MGMVLWGRVGDWIAKWVLLGFHVRERVHLILST